MNPENPAWRRISEVFDLVADSPPDQRDDLLAELCAGDVVLRRKVEALLRADAAAIRFDRHVESARASAVCDWNDDVDAESPGQRIGAWRVVCELGRGGMGVVLLAERADGQYEQQAALKLIKRGMDSEAILARFLRERQILARLDHPHIAHLLDGGIAADGRPYFAMEYVEGSPLLDYCAGRNLEERLHLFLQICDAVQFAHARLVVHRDIKPGNILVGKGGEAKLLDFGIAKLLDESQAGASVTVDAQQRPLTPAYAAPEQWRGDAVSVATDVYALGAVLYELLSGRRPFGFRDAPTAGEVHRAFAAIAPPPPSASPGVAGISARTLRGDLDTIVITALKRDPERRYPSVEAFSGDLRRLLDGRPITARRDSTGYRAGRFVARHRVGVAVSAVAIALLLASTTTALWQARAKAREAAASAEVTRFLVDLFRGSDPTLQRGESVTAQELLDRGAERLHAETGLESAVRARLLQTVAESYLSLGLYDRALVPAREALDLRGGIAAGSPREVAESQAQLGRVYRLKADYAAAEPLLAESLRLRRALLPADDPELIESLGESAALLRARGDFEQAAAPLREALASAERHFGNDSIEAARRLDDLAANLDDLGKRADAESAYRRALAIRERRLGSNDAEVATSLLNLGQHLDDSGEYGEARGLLERAVAIRRAIFGAAHPLVGFAEIGLAGVYQSQNRLDDAERHAQIALDLLQHSLPADHPRIAEVLNLLAILRMNRRDFAGSVPLARRVVDAFARTLGADHPDTLTAENNLSFALLHAGRFDEAEKMQRSILATLRKDDGQAARKTTMQNLAATLCLEGKHAEAVEQARGALELVRRSEGESSGNVAVALRSLAQTEECTGDDVAAERDLRATVAMGERLAKEKKISMFGWTVPLAELLARTHRCEEAMPLLDAAHDELAKTSDLAPETLPAVELLRGYCTGGESGARQMHAARAVLAGLPGIRIDLPPLTAKLLDSR